MRLLLLLLPPPLLRPQACYAALAAPETAPLPELCLNLEPLLLVVVQGGAVPGGRRQQRLHGWARQG